MVPFSTSDGPTTVDGLSARGFGHSPQGAALAGWQIFFRIAGSNNEVGRAIYDSQVVMARTCASRSTHDSTPKVRIPISNRPVHEVFRARCGLPSQEYADDLAVVEYALRDVPGATAPTSGR
ncbi:hypothetical protein GS584_25195 [Rhodococcus hoagii]|nr:hypothetical protein [Prescottella equi]